MFRLSQSRFLHYLLLLAIVAIMTLPNLHRTSLWDMDETVNAEAAREMMESGNLIVPKFNFQLRDAKPALLYWLQIAAYRSFGVTEFAARLPSTCAVALATLLLYELGRMMFSRAVGFMAGLILAGSVLVAAIAQFANPDALLLACTVLTFTCFWRGYMPTRQDALPSRAWSLAVGSSCGLAMLAKGPVGVVLPILVITAYLVWQRQGRFMWGRRFIYATAAFTFVAAPWYILVAVQTRGAFVAGFFVRDNLLRFLQPMDDHRGPIWFHAVSFLVGFAPWSVFLVPAILYSARNLLSMPNAQPDTPRPKWPEAGALRFLTCWVLCYFVFFTCCATKLPNYILPLYPAMALLSARYLVAWRHFHPHASSRWMIVAILLFGLIGIGVSVGALALGGEISLSGTPIYPVVGFAKWWWIGVPLVGGALLALTGIGSGRRRAALAALAAAAAVCLALVFALPIPAIDRLKPVPMLIATVDTFRRDQEIRLASYRFTQPSLVFYQQREVRQLILDEDVCAFLRQPLPGYIFAPETDWRWFCESHSDHVGVELARKWDPFRHCHILVIGNPAAVSRHAFVVAQN